jgi:hypothetical protein
VEVAVEVEPIGLIANGLTLAEKENVMEGGEVIGEVGGSGEGVPRYASIDACRSNGVIGSLISAREPSALSKNLSFTNSPDRE